MKTRDLSTKMHIESECNIEVCMSVWKWKLCWEQIVIICDVKREGKIRNMVNGQEL